MKRTNIFVMISAAVMLLAAAACTTDNLQTDGNFISLSISSKSMETKATQDGVDELNENIINDIYYFFYEKGKTDATPVIKGSLKGLDLKSGTKTEEIPVAANAAGALFASSNKCQVFLVANPPESMGTTLSGSPTLETLRALTFVTSLKGTQESFTMVFDGEEKQNGLSGNIMTVEADMQRLASKMTFAMNTSKTCTDASSTWTSDPDKAKITFYNAFKETNLAGDFEALKETDDKYKEKFFDSDAIEFTAKTEQDTDWHNVAKQPVYSYPETWDFTGSTEPYILIELPWTKSGATSPVTYYYKIFLDAKELKMNTWCNLTINIDRLGSTTPEDPEQLFSNLTYLVLSWNDAFESGDGITADVEEPRYLMLNKKEFEIYNQESWNIPFTSSHDCEIIDIEYKKWDYTLNSGDWSGKQTTYDNDVNSLSGLDITIDGSLITFTHTLNNNINDASPNTAGITFGHYDIAEYEISFTIKHKDKNDGTYSERITVTQYPAIYIKALPNSQGKQIQTSYANSTAYVNIASTKVSDYGENPHEVFKTSANIGNKNGNMYLITTTTAPDLTVVKNDPTTKYILGDPRSNTAMIPKSGIFDGHEWLGSSSTTHTPTLYYPTENEERVTNVIAPKIRVASSWGQTTSLTYENAKYRCAAYQEDGYPAGRWRVPTAAELMYVCKLSSDHMIPMLYGSAGETKPSYYWCSTGFVEVYSAYQTNYATAMEPANDPIYHSATDPATKAVKYWRSEIRSGTKYWYQDVEFNDNTKFSVRCVYDEWYWENTSDTTPYTTENGRMPEGSYNVQIWGDRER